MNIFGSLFNKFFNNSRNRNSYVNASDRTPAKVQIMRHALVGIRVNLVGIPIKYSNYKYRLLVPKRLYAPYKEAMKRAEKNKKLSAMDKTRIDGYLNPKYHYAEYPCKRVH